MIYVATIIIANQNLWLQVLVSVIMHSQRWLTHTLIVLLVIINVYNLATVVINCMQVIWRWALMNVSEWSVLRWEGIFSCQSKWGLWSVLTHVFLCLISTCGSGHTTTIVLSHQNRVVMSKRSVVVHFILWISSWSKRQLMVLMMVILHEHFAKLIGLATPSIVQIVILH